MFKEELFDCQRRPFPKKGMNQDVAPLLMSADSAVYIDNILPFPKGEGVVRYGTRTILEKVLPFDAVILDQFPANFPDGSSHIVFYVREFVKETGTLLTVQDNHLTIEPVNASFYQEDFDIRLAYASPQGGADEKILTLSRVETEGGRLILFTGEFSFPRGTTISSLSYGSGSLYVADLQTRSLKKIKDKLLGYCIPHHCTYKGCVFICNGVNKVMRWDGQELKNVQGWAKETTASLMRNNATSLSFIKPTVFDEKAYLNGVKLMIRNETHILKAPLIRTQGERVVLHFSENLPTFDPKDASLFYLKDVPRFSWMRVLHGRIFALGEGVSGLGYRVPDQAMRVYFQYQSNSLEEWFSPTTKSVPSLNLWDTHGIPDNLEAISFMNGRTLFMGRKKIQVWTGSEPLGAAIAEGKPLLQYAHPLNLGIMHRNLFTELPNETIICNENGLFSLSLLGNLSGQFEAKSLPVMNAYIRHHSGDVTMTRKGWETTTSCLYPQGHFFIFRLATTKSIAAIIESTITSFCLFSGDFQWAGSFLSTLDNTLYLSVGNTLYQYADENSGVPLYGDKGGKSLIGFVWALAPFTGRRWANKYVQMEMSYPSSFLLLKDNQMIISVAGDLRESFDLDLDYALPFKGDTLESVPALFQSEYSDDDPDEEELGQRMDYPHSMPVERLRFPASTFFVTVSGYTNSGKLSFKKISLFGHYGRKV